MAIDVTVAVSTLIAQAPLLAIAIAILMLYFERRFHGLEMRFETRFHSLEMRLQSIEMRIDNLCKVVMGLINFGETLLSIHASKGFLSDSEYKALDSMLTSLAPFTSSKYYTKEVAERLRQILAKEPSQLTWDDVFELEKIFDLMVKEGLESNRDDLISYAFRLKALIGIAKGLLLRRGLLPPPRHIQTTSST